MAVQTKAIKQRIKSIRNTRKVTKAMELVAASKMRKAVSRTLDSRPYSKYALHILLSLFDSNISHPFLIQKQTSKILAVVITSNRGLCGAFNAQVIRNVIALAKTVGKENIECITVGKKGDAAIRRMGLKVIATFEAKENVDIQTVLSVNALVEEQYKKENYKEVKVFYTDYVSVLVQKPIERTLLPLSKETIISVLTDGKGIEGKGINERETPNDFVFEPGRDEVVNMILYKIIRMQLYAMFLESSASEQSARMMAMKNATEAAGEMMEDLTLMFNKIRQAGITQEISEISAGQASVT